ncbi:SMI1/KNR4 family protein [Sedimenticola selenatireducens]|uniref:SMI1/KNR4 family protein n=1 Tax=Sedimenticola selenatireducens TaxID=191960 RepID=A0A557SI33_9GAMM|nr:SMI1/KNR4 family protein [Sedimenticola selenatireducens]TVO77085.1 SMI1/KNR4 family protein [Sedimenticola selenatireducens]TVT64528.1 MAG: SMI1/KNR4 family protein [Sedimenticola selenatireducens]
MIEVDQICEGSINYGGCSDEKIRHAERELDVTFPESYRYFLKTYGSSIGDSLEIYGLPDKTDDQPLWINCVEQTIKDRQLVGIPKAYVAISHDGMESAYYLDCSESPISKKCVVIEWSPTNNGGKTIFTSFSEFLQSHGKP